MTGWADLVRLAHRRPQNPCFCSFDIKSFRATSACTDRHIGPIAAQVTDLQSCSQTLLAHFAQQRRNVSRIMTAQLRDLPVAITGMSGTGSSALSRSTNALRGRWCQPTMRWCSPLVSIAKRSPPKLA